MMTENEGTNLPDHRLEAGTFTFYINYLFTEFTENVLYRPISGGEMLLIAHRPESDLSMCNQWGDSCPWHNDPDGRNGWKLLQTRKPSSLGLNNCRRLFLSSLSLLGLLFCFSNLLTCTLRWHKPAPHFVSALCRVSSQSPLPYMDMFYFTWTNRISHTTCSMWDLLQ